MIKKTLCIAILSFSFVSLSLNTAYASSMHVDGTEIIKEQDPFTKNVRVKAIFTDKDDLRELRTGLHDRETMTFLKPYLATNQVTYEDRGDKFVLTMDRTLVPIMTPYLNEILEDDIGRYLKRFDTAPAKSILFQAPKNFNATIYGLYNPDVQRAYRPTDGALNDFLTAHFVNFGFSEGRRYELPSDFDASVYLRLNNDLANASSKLPDRNYFAISHYIQFGENESRAYKVTLPANFASEDYLALNPDLGKAASTKNIFERSQFAKDHYISHGFFEGRRFKIEAPADFNVFTYFRLNPDIEKVFGNLPYSEQEAQARVHFSNFGTQENRKYK